VHERVEQGSFDTYQMLRMNEAPAVEVHIVQSAVSGRTRQNPNWLTPHAKALSLPPSKIAA